MQAEIALANSNFPVYEKTDSCFGDLLIVSVDQKWIIMKRQGKPLNAKNITRYKVSNGWRERSRSSDGAIDAKKAIQIWNERPR